MILLDERAIRELFLREAHSGIYGFYDAMGVSAKAQAKKIFIKLQAIYNLPDEGMFHKSMGEFIEGLDEEVSDNIC